MREPSAFQPPERRADLSAPAPRRPQPTDGVLKLQGTAGNRAVSQLLRDSRAELVVQRFSQTAVKTQDSHHGGVKSQYEAPQNLIELHIDAGANAEGKLMQDFLLALWEARDALTAGQARPTPVPGHVFMRPGGAKVLKMTMELLGEALGARPGVAAAREAKQARQKAKLPLGEGIREDRRDDTIDSTFALEHIAYRDSLVGTAGITMTPAGKGTSQGTVDMLATGAAAENERDLYDQAIMKLTPFMTIGVMIDLTALNAVISMLEGRAKWYDLAILKAQYLVKG